MEKFWMVWREGGGVPTKKHADYNSARREAERLAMANNRARFVVLEALEQCEVNPVVWTTATHPEIPF